MIFEDNIFKTFMPQIYNEEVPFSDMPFIPQADRRCHKLSSQKAVKTYDEFSCEDSRAVYLSGPAQLLSDQNHSVPHKVLDWNHLRVFYYVAQYRSFTKAAHVLKMSQPALSRTVKHLEIRLEEKVFHRNRRTRRLTLTSTGSMILDIIAPGVLQLESLMFHLQK